MCGFTGLLRWASLTPKETNDVRVAADVLAHRGPDNSGFWRDARVALGFRRLKVIDLSPTGDQPMGNEDGSVQVVFNGEIYNFRELRDDLRAQGHTFKSQSDTEVLPHLYEQYGEALLPRLRGMFAFALWDTKKQRLLLARDPLGVKPLYFAERAGAVAFASEAKALFALGVKPELDVVALDEALTYRYVPAPRSGFKNVEKLPPGSVAIAENGTLRYQRWWTWPSGVDVGAVREPPANANAEPLTHIENAVRRRLVSDVPLGAWLSGGIDSGLIVSRMIHEVQSFTAGFAQSEYDERTLARATAQRLKTKLFEFEISADVFQLLPQIVWHGDEPFFDSSCLPTFVLAKETKPYATVVLSGDGGDEAFAGYDRYVGMQWLARYRRIPSVLRSPALGLARWWRSTASRQSWGRSACWLDNCLAMERAGYHPYLAAMELFSAEQKRSLYGDRMLESTIECDAREYLETALLRAREASGAATTTAPSVLQRTDLETYLPGDVLHKVDRMSMAHGLEIRSPFLDTDLVMFALSLSDATRLPGRKTKPLLRAAARRFLPPEVVNARKHGFGVPLDDWFRGPIQKIALAIFEESALVADQLFKPRYWNDLWLAHQRGQAQHGERLYALLALELWHRIFISGAAPLTRPARL
ncbi:MAG: asparagine synthase (glutamine-hydrolyzing) [Planctomycetota bacterium]